jgi:hypothetical protein
MEKGSGERRGQGWMKSVYVAGPYSGAEDVNVLRAAEVAADYIKRGWIVFCPHTHSNIIDRKFNKDKLITYEDWLILDLYWLSRCDAIHMVSGWRLSKGASLEYLVAQALGKEIRGDAE